MGKRSKVKIFHMETRSSEAEKNYYMKQKLKNRDKWLQFNSMVNRKNHPDIGA